MTSSNHFKALVLLGVVLSVFMLNTAVGGEWQRKSDMLRKRGEHANFVYGGKIYVLGGIHDHVYGPANIEVYDPATDKWENLGVWDRHRHHITAGSSLYGDEVWICGGKPAKDDSWLKDVWVYNVAENSWRQGPELPEVHWGGAVVILDDKLHVMTGAQGRSQTTTHHFVLDLKHEKKLWEKASSVPAPRVHVAGVAFDGKIWLIGGEYHHRHDGDTVTVQVYDPATDMWDMSKPQLPMARSHHEWATFVHDRKIYCVSGVDSVNRSERGQSNIYVYDTAGDQWKELTPLPHKMCSPAAKIVGDKLYVFGGGGSDWFSGSMRETWALNIDELAH